MITRARRGVPYNENTRWSDWLCYADLATKIIRECYMVTEVFDDDSIPSARTVRLPIPGAMAEVDKAVHALSGSHRPH